MIHEGSEGLCVLLERNKSLEIIRSDSTRNFVDFPSLRQMQKLNPRIRRYAVSLQHRHWIGRTKYQYIFLNIQGPGDFDPESIKDIQHDSFYSDITPPWF